ncbi:MAG: 3-dehydroquinate synthase [Ginsengibacter sp.]
MKNNKMIPKKYSFSSETIDVYFNGDFTLIEDLVDKGNAIVITDENIFAKQSEKFNGWKTIVLKVGEQFKNQHAVDEIINQLIDLNADRQTFIVGVGGGVVTDIAGFAASVYMRGIKFAFVPTSILAMVDASVGGKNGVDVGVYKNLVGTINHPEFLLYDYSFLETLPHEEWINGFAEIIKHACIRDESMFYHLEEKSLADFQSLKENIGKLIRQNVDIKCNVVASDERETGERKLLNFGHTIGHAIENTAKLPHGSAVSIGMVAACVISEKINDFSKEGSERVKHLLSKYQLPVAFNFDKEKTWEILLHDKKKTGSDMNFVVLDKIGRASIKKIPLNDLQKIFYSLS